jgi:hypothetical protein
MASGASAYLVAGVIHINIIIQQILADRLSRFGFKSGAIWAQLYMR